jgi:hypothetical protein
VSEPRILSMALADAVALHAAQKRGDAEAERIAAELFPAATRCWLCDAEAPAAKVAMLEDPADPAMALLAPLYRAAKELRMCRAMWPKKRWTFNHSPRLAG